MFDLRHRWPKSHTLLTSGPCHSFCTTRRLPAQHQVIGAHCPEKGTVYMIGLWTKKKRQDTQVVANRFFSVVRSSARVLYYRSFIPKHPSLLSSNFFFCFLTRVPRPLHFR